VAFAVFVDAQKVFQQNRKSTNISVSLAACLHKVDAEP
jgi:hypothetical protein